MDDARRDQLIGRLATAVEALEDRLDTMQENLAVLAARVGLGARHLEESPPSDSVDTWVSWLIQRYELSDAIPACWEQHTPIVEELKALQTAWVGASDPIDARPADALLWHEALQRCLGRIRDWDRTKCRTRGHTP